MRCLRWTARWIDRLGLSWGKRKRALPVAQALTILRQAYGGIADSMMIYSAEGVLLYANDTALRDLRVGSVAEHPSLRARMLVFEQDGRQLDRSEWPIFRAMRGETVVDCELDVVMPNLAAASAWRSARINARLTTFDGLVDQPLILVSISDVTRYKEAEAKLRAEEQAARREQRLLSAVLDSLHVAVVIADPAGQFVRTNWAYPKLFGTDLLARPVEGYAAFEGYDRDSGRRLDPIDWPLASAIRDGNTTVRQRIDIKRSDEVALRHMSFSASPIHDDTGDVLGGVVVAEDVTDLIRAEQAIRQNELRLRLLVDGVRDHAFYMLEPDGTVATWSAGGQRMKLYAASDIIGQPWSILFSARDTAEGLPQRLLERARTDNTASFDGWRYRKDGSRFWGHTAVSAIIENGDLVGFAAVTRDLTVERAAQAELKLRDTALHAVSQGILVCDVRSEDQPIILVSGGFGQMTGYSAEEVVGRNCRLLQGPATDPAALREIRDAITQGREASVELLNYRKDGSTFWNALYLSPVVDEDGEIDTFIGVIADVTERRHLEEKLRQAQKMDALGRMAGGIAHDFNNILTIINGNAEDLLDTIETDAAARERLDLIFQAGIRAERLTTQLLTFSRRSVVQPSNVDLSLVLDSNRHLLSSLAGGSVDLIVRIDAEIWPIWADRSQVEQVLLNVVINARDAMPEGGSITLSLENVAADGHDRSDQVLLRIRDTGHGMDSDTRARAFDPFFTTKGDRGSGLGLATVFGVVSQSGGTATLDSAPDQGTTVEIRFPRSQAPTLAQSDQREKQSAASFAQMTALVADDEPSVRQLIRRSLERRDFTVIEARNGREALALAQALPAAIDLMITDIVMPEMDGIALAAAMQAYQPNLPVLFVSGFPDAGIDTARGNAALLLKPFGARSLNAAIDRLMSSAPTPLAQPR